VCQDAGGGTAENCRLAVELDQIVEVGEAAGELARGAAEAKALARQMLAHRGGERRV